MVTTTATKRRSRRQRQQLSTLEEEKKIDFYGEYYTATIHMMDNNNNNYYHYNYKTTTSSANGHLSSSTMVYNNTHRDLEEQVNLKVGRLPRRRRKAYNSNRRKMHLLLHMIGKKLIIILMGLCSLWLITFSWNIHQLHIDHNGNVNYNSNDGTTTTTAAMLINANPSRRRNSAEQPDATIVVPETIPQAVVPAAAAKAAANDNVVADVNNNTGVIETILKHEYWDNPNNIVHVIQTRFMQYQPNLVSLGKARIELLKALTIPSIIHQTEQNFLWLIRTDPNLNNELLNELILLLSDIPNVILIASNENPEGFRHAITDITIDTVLVGNIQMVYSYHKASLTHTLLETRLDADDSVSIDFVQIIQQAAIKDLVPVVNSDDNNEDTSSSSTNWMVWCAENHIEWQYSSPWNKTITTGALIGIKTGQCITPGLTWGYNPNAKKTDTPVSKHTEIHKQVPYCNENENSKKKKKKHNNNSNEIEPSSDTKRNCLVKLGGEIPLALRARTPTSAGMEHVLITNYTEHIFPIKKLLKSQWKKKQNELWKSLKPIFGVESNDLWYVRNYIQNNIAFIAKDALIGQCTRGHSCKSSSKQILEQLANITITT